jgi:hypothetical protein
MDWSNKFLRPDITLKDGRTTRKISTLADARDWIFERDSFQQGDTEYSESINLC